MKIYVFMQTSFTFCLWQSMRLSFVSLNVSVRDSVSYQTTLKTKLMKMKIYPSTTLLLNSPERTK